MMTEHLTKVTVVGAGVLGLWQALACARAGFSVRLIEQNSKAIVGNASVLAGGMLAPDCEREAAPELVRDLGHGGVSMWKKLFPDVIACGSLVVAGARDRAELTRFSKMTSGFEPLDEVQLSAMEPDLAGRFSSALFFADEAHVVVPEALAFLLCEVRRLGVEVILGERFCFGQGALGSDDQVIIDCRGMAARDDPDAGMMPALSRLRGVRGERIIVQTEDVHFHRPVRLLHPRHPIYVVPWDKGRFVVGATVIESADKSGASVRSVLELLSTAFALNPTFGEAELLHVGAGVRPAFPDNIPRAVVLPDHRVISVNGAYRHGFLLAPVLADAVLCYLQDGDDSHPLIVGPGFYSSNSCTHGQ